MAPPTLKEDRSNRSSVRGAWQPPSGVTPLRNDVDMAAESGVDLGQLWAALQENRRFVVGIAAIGFCLIMTMTMLASMTFKSSGRLYLGELETKTRAASNSGSEMDLTGGGQGDVGSEIEIMKSQSLVARAISDSGLNVSITPEGWRPPRYWKWLASGRNTHLADAPTEELNAVHTSLSTDTQQAHSYTVTFTTDTEYDLYEAGNLLGQGKLGRPLIVPGLDITLVRGSTRAPEPGRKYDITVRALDVVSDAVLANLSVSLAKTAGPTSDSAKVVTLEFTDSSPYFAATFLRKLMTGYLNERQTWKTENARAAEDFVTQQLHSLRESLAKTESSLAEYRRNNRVVVLDNEAKAMVEQIGKYEEQRVAARLEVAALSDMKRMLRSPSPSMESFLIGEARDSVFEDLSNKLTAARRELDLAYSQFGAESPQARQARSAMDAQLETVRGYVNNRLSRAQESLNSLGRIIQQFEDKLKTVPGAELGLAQLARESEVYSRVYSYMLERQQQAAITKASTVSKNRILDYPKLPYREDSPKLGLRLASGPLALLLGAVLVLLRRFFSSQLQSDSEIRQLFTAFPVYASLPQRVRSKQTEGDVGADLAGIDLASAYAEGLRTLRTNLYHAIESDSGRVVLVTSPRPGDGKTSAVLALASMLAIDGKRVLVVDTDMRKPSHHELVGSNSSRPGLRGVLSAQCHWRDAIDKVGVSLSSFDSLSAGRMAPAELLSSERMTRFLADVRNNYDFVLLDAPSFPLVADPLSLARLADCTLTVLRPQHTPRKVAVEHTRRMSVASASYGIVVNDVNTIGAVYPASYLEPPSFGARLVQGVMRTLGLTSSGRNQWLGPVVTAIASFIALAGLTMVIRDQREAPPEHDALVLPADPLPQPSVEPTLLEAPALAPGAEAVQEPAAPLEEPEHVAAPEPEPVPAEAEPPVLPGAREYAPGYEPSKRPVVPPTRTPAKNASVYDRVRLLGSDKPGTEKPLGANAAPIPVNPY